MSLGDFDPDILFHYGVKGMKWGCSEDKGGVAIQQKFDIRFCQPILRT